MTRPGRTPTLVVVPALIDTVAAFADAHALLPGDARVLVAVSGGPDSVCLLDLLSRLRATRAFPLTVGHFHHGLRGAEAEADAAFVQARAEALGLPFLLGRAAPDVPRDEAALRMARYDWLQAAASACGATHVAVGHTRDDQLETVLLRLLRGTGLRGLGGMRPRRRLHAGGSVQLIRPLLETSRADVEAYLRDRAIASRTDSTNADPRYARNRLRADVVPLLRAVQPGVDARVGRTADRLAADDAYLREAAASLGRVLERGRGPGWCCYDRPGLAVAPRALASRILRAAYRRVGQTAYAPSADAIDHVMRALEAGDPRGAVDWPGGVRVRWSARQMSVCRILDPDQFRPVPLAVPGDVMWRPTGQHVAVRAATRGRGTEPAPGPEVARFRCDASDVPERLVVRGWCAGDRWVPVGRGGSESVAETLRVAGVPVDCRPATPVLATDRGVWWVPGARPPALDATADRAVFPLEVTVAADAGLDPY